MGFRLDVKGSELQGRPTALGRPATAEGWGLTSVSPRVYAERTINERFTAHEQALSSSS